MSFSINSNSLAIRVANSFREINQALDRTSTQIATGKRINSAKDDPAGLAQVVSLKSRFSSYGVVRNNLTFGTSLLESASTALNNVQANLKSMRDLAVQAASGTLTTEQRAALQTQFAEYQSQIDQTVNNATVFGQNLVGSAAADVDIQSGINAGDTTTVTAVASDAATLAVDAGSIDLSDSTAASAAITAIDAAIGTVATNQSTFGSQLNRFDVMDKNVASIMENIDSARSRIEDADIPALTTELQQLQVKSQLASAMLGLVNSLPQGYLSLLR